MDIIKTKFCIHINIDKILIGIVTLHVLGWDCYQSFFATFKCFYNDALTE